MTEALPHFLTPIVLICTPGVNQELVTKDRAIKKYQELSSEQVILINQANDTILIDQVRELTQRLSFASFQGKLQHIFLLHADKATTEAQNALLKLLEEPPTNTQFWLATDRVERILPTVMSRCEEWRIPPDDQFKIEKSVSDLAHQIPKLSHRELSEIAEHYSDRTAAVNFMHQLLHFFHVNLEQSHSSADRKCVEVVLRTIHYLEANINVRLTLEVGLFQLKQLISRGTVL